MPKHSEIPHRTTTSLTINRELLEKAKERGLNISLILDGALSRELNITCEKAFLSAMERQNKVYKDFLSTFNLNEQFDIWKYRDNNNVVEKKPQRENKSVIRGFEGI